jgi:carbamoyl-phosphate synthase large subunit
MHGIPNPTEINIGRFFTTHFFFTKAGLNMPQIYVKLAFGEKLSPIKKKINPLTEGIAWVRGMDIEPVLTDIATINQAVADLKERSSCL